MSAIALPVLSMLIGLLRSRTLLHLKILALRQQLAMINQTPRKRLRFHWDQRLFWVWLYRLWSGCLQTLYVFKPDTLAPQGLSTVLDLEVPLPDGRATTYLRS